MRASDFYIGFVENIRMRASNPKNEFCGLIKIPKFPLKKIYLKILSAKYPPFCLRLNVLASVYFCAYENTSVQVLVVPLDRVLTRLYTEHVTFNYRFTRLIKI